MMILSEALGAPLPCQSFRETERVSLSQSAKAPASTRRRSGIARCQAFVPHHVMTGGGGAGGGWCRGPGVE